MQSISLVISPRALLPMPHILSSYFFQKEKTTPEFDDRCL
jgi:hypothetical protein